MAGFLGVSLQTGGCTGLQAFVHNGFKVGPNYCRPPVPVARDWIDAADVRVDLPRRTKIAGFIPRAVTGLQVKKSDMSGTKIVNEMRPAPKRRVTAKGGRAKTKGLRRNKLRPVIAELAAKGGAYIIVSAKGSTTDSALRSRRTVMRSALGRREQKLLVEFYDRGRLATWLRGHPGLGGADPPV